MLITQGYITNINADKGNDENYSLGDRFYIGMFPNSSVTNGFYETSFNQFEKKSILDIPLESDVYKVFLLSDLDLNNSFIYEKSVILGITDYSECHNDDGNKGNKFWGGRTLIVGSLFQKYCSGCLIEDETYTMTNDFKQSNYAYVRPTIKISKEDISKYAVKYSCYADWANSDNSEQETTIPESTATESTTVETLIKKKYMEITAE